MSESARPRWLPDEPFPPYAYLPRRAPHPTRDPAGHAFGREPAPVARPDPRDWRACGPYLRGIDLFNHGYYWEAHEAWESLWHACGRSGPTADFLRGLIRLAAAGFKAREGRANGVRRHAQAAGALFAQGAARSDGVAHGRLMGLDLREMRELAAQAAAAATLEPAMSSAPQAVFAFVLRPA